MYIGILGMFGKSVYFNYLNQLKCIQYFDVKRKYIHIQNTIDSRDIQRYI